MSGPSLAELNAFFATWGAEFSSGWHFDALSGGEPDIAFPSGAVGLYPVPGSEPTQGVLTGLPNGDRGVQFANGSSQQLLAPNVSALDVTTGDLIMLGRVELGTVPAGVRSLFRKLGARGYRIFLTTTGVINAGFAGDSFLQTGFVANHVGVGFFDFLLILARAVPALSLTTDIADSSVSAAGLGSLAATQVFTVGSAGGAAPDQVISFLAWGTVSGNLHASRGDALAAWTAHLNSYSPNPTITVVSPTPGVAPGAPGGFPADYATAKDTPVVIEVSDAIAPPDHVDVAHVLADGSELVVVRAGVLVPPYDADSTDDIAGATRTLSLRRSGGWPGGDLVLRLGAIDEDGNQATGGAETWQLPAEPPPPVIPAPDSDVTLTEARDAIYSRFLALQAAAFPTVPVTFDNEVFDPQELDAWIRAAVRHVDSQLACYGRPGRRTWERTGLVLIQVFTAPDIGTQGPPPRSDELVTAVRDGFEGVVFDGVHCTNAVIRELGNEGRWWQVNVEARFVYREHR